ncbi:Phytochrome-like protein cph2 [Marinomonas spartinae]|uniref:diguanylate cyclase n=1 Tax=Marinomonas spartinae TaxID=1792290 RepID=A0A1A8TFW4_9GAMM|nr:diguanylate cyclase [Marinomonas spartinae]SBS30821.1 Phytochrome-like protein cph2 [Marinomonas spartinae]
MTEQQRVLVIDDEIINLKVISSILRDDVDVILAKSGKQGIRKAIELTPDLILLDVMMPGMDGFEVMMQLRHDVRTCAIPIIFITALSNEIHEEKGLLLGANDYIQKPLHTNIVRARIQLHLKLVKQQRMLERLANIDPLTSLANRRKYQDAISMEWDLAITNQHHISLAIIDIDNFKQYNDCHGHAAGDCVLQQVASVFSKQFNHETYLVARYGGEEFVVLLPRLSKEESLTIVRNCLKAVEQLDLPYHADDKRVGTVTISVGGATCSPSSSHDIDEFFSSADKMLYLAKKEGKNRVYWVSGDDSQNLSGLLEEQKS